MVPIRILERSTYLLCRFSNITKNFKVYDTDVAVFKPGSVESNLGFKMNKRMHGTVSAEKAVTCCLYDIVNGKLETNGVTSHTFTNFILKIVPKEVINRVYTYKRYKHDITEHENILDKDD